MILSISIYAQENTCPTPNFTPQEVIIDSQNDSGEKVPYIDNSRAIKDLGTDFVVKEFFSTPESLFNFLTLVYNTIDKSLENFKSKNNLEDRALVWLFKGGNVLRMVANGFFSLLPDEAAQELKKAYEADFKRSDADFTVYIDETKINNLDYNKILDNITELIYENLNKIREEFKNNPTKYFDFFKLSKNEADAKLKEYFDQLIELPLISDPKNEDWYKVRFKQLQLLNGKATDYSDCSYLGQFDYRFVNINGKIVGLPLSAQTDWIMNSDNRTLEWPLGTDFSKLVKFNLVRAKAGFEYSYEQDHRIHRRPIGGELIDISLPHREDASTREFLDNYDNNIVTYKILSPDKESFLEIKSYSIEYLAHDLLNILFGQFDRPWNGGPKYGKRVNRLFFLGIIDMLATFPLGSEESKEYIALIKEKILNTLKDKNNLGENIKNNVDFIINKYPTMQATNDFWRYVSELINGRMQEKPEDSDAKEFDVFINLIEQNLNNYENLMNHTQKILINPKALYDTNMNNLF
jgi:hypothetical protein